MLIVAKCLVVLWYITINANLYNIIAMVTILCGYEYLNKTLLPYVHVQSPWATLPCSFCIVLYV